MKMNFHSLVGIFSLLVATVIAIEKCPPGFVFDFAKGCQPCAPGTFESELSYCHLCDAGTYQPLPGQTRCITCPEGSNSSHGASKCVSCAPDEAMLNDNRCGKCGPGTYYDNSSYFCSECYEGFYKAEEGFGPCLPCPKNGHSGSGASECIICPENQAPMSNGTCMTCSPGQHYDMHSKSCSPCSQDKYMDIPNINTGCYTCAENEYSLSGASRCSRCPSGMFYIKSKGICERCQPGEYYSTYEKKCSLCNYNEFTVGLGEQYCKACMPGSFAFPGSTTCFACPLGTLLLAKTRECGKCPDGYEYRTYDASCVVNRRYRSSSELSREVLPTAEPIWFRKGWPSQTENLENVGVRNPFHLNKNDQAK